MVVAAAVDVAAVAVAEEFVVALSEKFGESRQGRVGYGYKCHKNSLKITFALKSKLLREHKVQQTLTTGFAVSDPV